MTIALKILNAESAGGKAAVVEIVDVHMAEPEVSRRDLKPQEEIYFGVSGTRHLRILHPESRAALQPQQTGGREKLLRELQNTIDCIDARSELYTSDEETLMVVRAKLACFLR